MKGKSIIIRALMAALYKQETTESWVLSYGSINIFFDRKPDIEYERDIFEELTFSTDRVKVQFTVHRGQSVNGPQIFIHK